VPADGVSTDALIVDPATASGVLAGRLAARGALQLSAPLVNVTVPVGEVGEDTLLMEAKRLSGCPYGREAPSELTLMLVAWVPPAAGAVHIATTPACCVRPRRSLDDGASHANEVRIRPKTASHE